jgi:single-strand DNA-binding protein
LNFIKIIIIMNRCQLYGNLGSDPKVTNLQSGKKVAKFSLATNRTYSNASGERVTETQWHSIVSWGKLAELCEKYLKKGNSVIIEGEINYRSYENKEGVTVYITEIVGNGLHFTGSKQEEKPEAKDEWQGKKQVGAMSNISELPGNVADYDDIPDDKPPF